MNTIEFMTKIKKKIYIHRAKALILLFSLTLPIKKKVLFESFNGMNYSDNPKAISEKLRSVDPEFEIVWAFSKKRKKTIDIPKYIKTVNYSSWRYYKELATSFAYIRNTQYESWVKKRKGKQLFFQPWHGDRTMKKILYQAHPNRKDKIYDDMVVDYCISGSTRGTNMYREAFRYTGEILEIGCPRNDVLLSEQMKTKEIAIREKYGICKDTKILLYAPTFRDKDINNQNILIDVESVIRALEEKTHFRWICMLRAHPNVISGMEKGELKDVIDVSKENDAADLLCAANMLISDYSSIATDFMLTDKPIILAIFDENEYENNNREFEVLPDETGLITARTNKELLSVIYNTSLEEYKRRCEISKKFYGVRETGHSSEYIVNLISQECNTLFNKEDNRDGID